MIGSASNALVGYTGFVGGNLMQQAKFDATYNSQNIREIEGRSHDMLTIAGAQAKKWWANQNPEADWLGIERLIGSLAKCRAERVVLVSTIDVLGSSSGLAEDDTPATDLLGPYGRHRLRLEEEVQSLFRDVLIVRLPGLFGPGLKKNVLFDLLHRHELEKINPKSSFQYYGLGNFWADIQLALNARLRLVHLFPEPLPTSVLIEKLFPGVQVGGSAVAEAHYDHRTRYGSIFGGNDNYIATAEAVVQQLRDFVESAQSSPR
jgi:hypothetical protein